MIRLPPSSTRTAPLFPSTSLFRSPDEHPAVRAALAEKRAASYDVKVADVDYYPRLSAVGGLNHYDYLDSLASGTGPRNRDQGTTGYVGMQLKIPIRSEEHTSELQSLMRISYAVFCLTNKS